ncbi:MAG: hypothetical protein C4521_01890 [Actinobacteria bacterium]|jgi:hypothetical protein|nr:MAG: hypothetical protein C4521_01890 [Actinomycetota bacterium]
MVTGYDGVEVRLFGCKKFQPARIDAGRLLVKCGQCEREVSARRIMEIRPVKGQFRVVEVQTS